MATSLETGAQVRRLLQDLPSDRDRCEALIMSAVCLDCGSDHSVFYERRGWWMCFCEESDSKEIQGRQQKGSD